MYENNKMKPIARLFLFASLLFPSVLTAGVRFPYRFAPSEGFTNRLEKPYRDEVCLNGSWNFQPGETCTGAWEDVYLLRRGRSGLLRPLRRWHLPAGYPDKTCQINRL